MGEPKLCPLKSSAPYDCIKEKCAWWVPAVEGCPDNATHPQEWGRVLSNGHCAVHDLARLP